jgi:hypothetical protein
MRALLAGFAVLSLVACGGRNGGGDDDGGGGGDGCVGLECQVVDCAKQSKPPTTLTGTVFAPNGTLPLFGVNVYVPRETPAPFTEGAQCSRCTDELSGKPLAVAVTDDAGKFRLEGVPAGDDIPLVITTGKWRRQIVIPKVDACTEAALPSVDTRLPKNKSEGDIPRIAITTGSADSMECLPRKLGIDDTEITNATSGGRIHLYAGNGVNRFNGTFAGGPNQTFSGAEPFWNSLDTMKTYDIVILSCEGSQLTTNNNVATPKTQAALDAMKMYADLGGRVFASHWHNIWISGKFQGGVGAPTPQVWNTIAQWRNDGSFNGPDRIDETGHGKGMSFASWMLNVGASTTRGEFPVTEGRLTTTAIDQTKAERWVYRRDGNMNPQMFQFTTPNEEPQMNRCGKVVFTDMHVSGTIVRGENYPDSCVGGATNLDLSPQEKALAFMFFDIASCVGPIF